MAGQKRPSWSALPSAETPTQYFEQCATGRWWRRRESLVGEAAAIVRFRFDDRDAGARGDETGMAGKRDLAVDGDPLAAGTGDEGGAVVADAERGDEVAVEIAAVEGGVGAFDEGEPGGVERSAARARRRFAVARRFPFSSLRGTRRRRRRSCGCAP